MEVVKGKSPFAYIGGKSRLAPQIIEQIPEHNIYCEVFGGAAWVFFRKEPSVVEVVNDLDSNLINFYRVVQNHKQEFLNQFGWVLNSRELFNDWNAQMENGGGVRLTDIQRAARYFFLQRSAYGGRVTGRTYGVQVDGRAPRVNLERLEGDMEIVRLRLANVRIENLPWGEFIPRYDKPETFFFCDPPYYLKPMYKHNLTLPDYEAMAELLAGIKGKFLLTINDVPEMRRVFKAFSGESVTLLYSANQKRNVTGKELIVRNY